MTSMNLIKGCNRICAAWRTFVLCAIIGMTAVVTGCDNTKSTSVGPELSAVEQTAQVGVEPVALQDDQPEVTVNDRSISRAASSNSALSNAHAMLGKNPFGQKYLCLKYVRSWAGLSAKHATAAAAMKNYKNKGVFHSGSDPKKAPKGAWLFYNWKSDGHVAMRCGDGAIHQDNSSSGKGRIAHDSDGKVGDCTYRGYVTYEDAVGKW